MAISDEYQELGGITFAISRPAYEAQDGMSNALRLLAMVDMKKLPKYNLENIIRLLIAMCIDCFKKLGINNEVIAKMEISLRELYANN